MKWIKKKIVVSLIGLIVFAMMIFFINSNSYHQAYTGISDSSQLNSGQEIKRDNIIAEKTGVTAETNTGTQTGVASETYEGTQTEIIDDEESMKDVPVVGQGVSSADKSNNYDSIYERTKTLSTEKGAGSTTQITALSKVRNMQSTNKTSDVIPTTVLFTLSGFMIISFAELWIFSRKKVK